MIFILFLFLFLIYVCFNKIEKYTNNYPFYIDIQKYYEDYPLTTKSDREIIYLKKND